MSLNELKVNLGPKAALLCNITAWINSVYMLYCRLPVFYYYFYEFVSCRCNNYGAIIIYVFVLEKHILRRNLMESTLDQNVHNTCVIVLMTADNDRSVVVVDDGGYNLNLERRLPFKVKLVAHCMFWIVIVYFPVYRVLK